MSDLVLFKIEKTTARLLAQSQEMGLLLKATNPLPGNAGLREAAGLLFDPFVNFAIVRDSTKAVAASVTTSLHSGVYDPNGTYIPESGLNNGDTIVRCSSKGILQMEKKNTYIDNDSLDVVMAQDPDNVKGCFEQGTLKTYVTVPPVTLNRPSIVRLCPGFVQQEHDNLRYSPKTPGGTLVRKCRLLWNDGEAWLKSSNAKTVVDLAVAEDPYYEYERALLQTRPSNLNNGGLSQTRTQKILQAFKTPETDGWTAWRNNLGSGNSAKALVVPAAVAALSTLMEQQRYCLQTPNPDGTFQPSPGTQQGWITWVSEPDADWVSVGSR
ncbi:hypothetical protein HO173_010712 [Letharia columbiana]|uniref:Uncharacterized protein n=1 Tax=Letharia columbiana TaxID=112416 RepID=A0A8H6FM50_9LECA|nr:uncharacterized protein HO173_010712 [Letharia columbiana]KAF6231012.1 hypothetical protein HO173_010712 [Letharia columbiana]